ncbi:hypothetical protein UFOVP270_45 [uncultured Caudovirales phage]|uniref:Uncharacterized protein n=1 Tax=uncultured Caudovirales phage TaxID=2100421 RepID=A0A6J5LJI1_9CAUD|nr:hypothetical protein UFOVP101_12 [uncultured Caudovirales phage]CAB4134335.1 hypothetical protein UFOVP270_45 [uncultured Caudovirales phage]
MNICQRELALLLNVYEFLNVSNKEIDISKLEGIQELNFDLPKRTIKETKMSNNVKSTKHEKIKICKKILFMLNVMKCEFEKDLLCLKNESEVYYELEYFDGDLDDIRRAIEKLYED